MTIKYSIEIKTERDTFVDTNHLFDSADEAEYWLEDQVSSHGVEADDDGRFPRGCTVVRVARANGDGSWKEVL